MLELAALVLAFWFAVALLALPIARVVSLVGQLADDETAAQHERLRLVTRS